VLPVVLFFLLARRPPRTARAPCATLFRSEPVQLAQIFRLRRLNHQGTRYGERDRRGMEAIIHQTLGDILHFHTGRFELPAIDDRSEEHTSELQSRENLVCRLLLEQNTPVP